MDNTIDLIRKAGVALLALVLRLVAQADDSLSALMTQAGIDPRWQTLVLVVVFAVIFVAVLRSLGGLLGLLVLLFLLLLVVQRTSPETLHFLMH